MWLAVSRWRTELGENFHHNVKVGFWVGPDVYIGLLEADIDLALGRKRSRFPLCRR